MPLDRSDLSSPIKKINFLTSTVFEGSDIYDPDGRIIIISDPSKANTLLDISTSIQQIAGRIRNSKYINQIFHLYNTTRYSDLSYEEFKQKNLDNISTTQMVVEEYNNLSEPARKGLSFSVDYYIQTDKTNHFHYDPNMAKVDIYNFKVAKGMYTCRVNLESEYQKYSIETQSFNDDTKLSDLNVAQESFKDIVLKLKSGEPFLQVYKDKYPFLQEAINILGYDRISALNYVQKNIKNELLIKSDKSLDSKVLTKLSNYIQLGSFYTPGQIKDILVKVYKDLNIPETPKSSHITKYYICSETSKRIENNVVKGLIPIMKLFNITK